MAKKRAGALAKVPERPKGGGWRSVCPVACTLDLIGDRWTLLVVRDMLRGKSRFGEFMAAPEGIATNILAVRLQRLIQDGLVERSPAEDGRADRYVLTPAGQDLLGVLEAVRDWGLAHVKGTKALLAPGASG